MPKPTTDSTNKSSASDSAKDGRAALKKVFIFFSTDWLIEKSKIYLFLKTFFFLLPKSPNNNTNSISTLNDKKAGQPNSINSLNNTTNSQNSTTNNTNDTNKLDDVGFCS